MDERKNDGSDGSRAMLHRKRKRATAALLKAFEDDIEPLIRPGSETAIDDFKGVCRAKINGLTFEAIALLELEPGEALNMKAVDLAEALTLDETEDHPT